MAFQPTLNGARIVLVWGQGGDRWTNHFWARKASFTDSDMQQLADDVHQALSEETLDQLSSNTILHRIEVIDERTQGATLVASQNAQFPGGGSSSIAARHSSLIVTLRTAKRGRAFRGRVYLTGWTDEALTGNDFSAGAVTEAEAIVETVATVASNLGWTLGVRSGQLNGQVLEVANIEPITHFEVRTPTAGSQRRRVPRA